MSSDSDERWEIIRREIIRMEKEEGLSRRKIAEQVGVKYGVIRGILEEKEGGNRSTQTGNREKIERWAVREGIVPPGPLDPPQPNWLPSDRIAAVIRGIRDRLEMTQDAFAQALDFKGGQPEISKMESGKVRPRVSRLEAIAKLGGEGVDIFHDRSSIFVRQSFRAGMESSAMTREPAVLHTTDWPGESRDLIDRMERTTALFLTGDDRTIARRGAGFQDLLMLHLRVSHDERIPSADRRLLMEVLKRRLDAAIPDRSGVHLSAPVSLRDDNDNEDGKESA